jgi:hypothetical protein
VVDKLSTTASVIAALRAEMNNRTEAAGRKSAKRPEPAGQRAPVARDLAVLRTQLAELVKPVAVDDAAAVRAVRPKVVRAILLWEFGPQLREHPEWQPMLESITESLEAHAPHEADFLRLLSDLKR